MQKLPHIFLFFPLFGFLAFFSLGAQEVDANWTSGLQTFRPLLLPRNEERLEQGESRFRIQSTWLNIWSLQDDRFLIDAEEVNLSATFRYAIKKYHQIGLRVGMVYQSGGVLDRSIESAHRISGVGQGQRDRYPRDTLNVSYEPYGPYYPYLDRYPGESMLRRYTKRIYPRQPWLPPLDLKDRGLIANLVQYYINLGLLPPVETIPISGRARNGVEDPRFFWQPLLFQTNGVFSRLHGGLEIKLPAGGGELIGSPGMDVALSLTALFAWTEKLSMRIGVSWTRFGNTRYRFIPLAKEQWAIRQALLYQMGTMELVLEYLYFSKPTRSFGELAKPGHQIAAGLHIPIGQGTAAILLIENLVNFGITPDIALQTAYEMPL